MKTKYGNVDFSGQDDHNDGLITGLLLGVAIGACAAILFAPKSGKDLRGTIKDLAGKQTDNLADKWEKAKDKVSKVAGKAKDGVESAGSEAKSEFEDFADDAENEVRDGAETLADRFQKRY